MEKKGTLPTIDDFLRIRSTYLSKTEKAERFDSITKIIMTHLRSPTFREHFFTSQNQNLDWDKISKSDEENEFPFRIVANLFYEMHRLMYQDNYKYVELMKDGFIPLLFNDEPTGKQQRKNELHSKYYDEINKIMSEENVSENEAAKHLFARLNPSIELMSFVNGIDKDTIKKSIENKIKSIRSGYNQKKNKSFQK
jgi:hypothetical protein